MEERNRLLLKFCGRFTDKYFQIDFYQKAVLFFLLTDPKTYFWLEAARIIYNTKKQPWLTKVPYNIRNKEYFK